MGHLHRGPRRPRPRVTDAPIGASVVRSEDFDHDIRSSLGPERSPDGTRPSRGDFEHVYWPMLAAELAFAWREATQFIDDLPNVRELVCRPTAMFPPARVVINLYDGDADVVVTALGIQFDWAYRWADEHQ